MSLHGFIDVIALWKNVVMRTQMVGSCNSDGYNDFAGKPRLKLGNVMLDPCIAEDEEDSGIKQAAGDR